MHGWFLTLGAMVIISWCVQGKKVSVSSTILGSSMLLVVFLVCHERFAGGESSLVAWIVLTNAVMKYLTFQGVD